VKHVRESVVTEFCATSGKIAAKNRFCPLLKYFCKTAIDWVNRIITILMKVIITFTFYCDNLWKLSVWLWKRLGNSGNFLSPTFWSLCIRSIIRVTVDICIDRTPPLDHLRAVGMWKGIVERTNQVGYFNHALTTPYIEILPSFNPSLLRSKTVRPGWLS